MIYRRMLSRSVEGHCRGVLRVMLRVRSCNTTSPKQTEGKQREGRAFEKPPHE